MVNMATDQQLTIVVPSIIGDNPAFVFNRREPLRSIAIYLRDNLGYVWNQVTTVVTELGTNVVSTIGTITTKLNGMFDEGGFTTAFLDDFMEKMKDNMLESLVDRLNDMLPGDEI